MKIAVPQIWKNASPFEKRVYSTLMMLLIAILVLIIGCYIPISSQYAHELYDYRNQLVNDLGTNLGFATGSIFLNNFVRVCLPMFIPIIGPVMGLGSLLNTGTIFGALGTIGGYPPILIITSLMFSPVFWLEFFAYAIAMTESVWLLRRILQGRWRELKITGITIGICAVLLIIGALIEALPYATQL